MTFDYPREKYRGTPSVPFAADCPGEHYVMLEGQEAPVVLDETYWKGFALRVAREYGTSDDLVAAKAIQTRLPRRHWLGVLCLRDGKAHRHFIGQAGEPGDLAFVETDTPAFWQSYEAAAYVEKRWKGTTFLPPELLSESASGRDDYVRPVSLAEVRRQRAIQAAQKQQDN